MSYFTNSDGIRLSYQDFGDGPTVLLVAGWSLDATMWEHQVEALTAAGYRCVAMDRRGHGRSDEPGTGYDIDTLADDLAALIEHLDLRDVTIVGHSMGTAEATRYLDKYGSARVARMVFVGSILPGLRGALGEQAWAANLAELTVDRPNWFEVRTDGYFAMPGSPVSRAQAVDHRSVMLRVPLRVLLACLDVVGTDLSDALARLDVPLLLLHGDVDESAPLEITGRRIAEIVPGARLSVYEGGPHGLYVSHRDRLNTELLDFIKAV
jgi:non-heme chloroperoxidase